MKDEYKAVNRPLYGSGQIQAAPAQAQHSPLLWRMEKQGRAGWMLIAKEFKAWVDKTQGNILCRYHNETVAHAQRLADALTNLTGRAVTGLHQDATHDGLVNCEAIARAREALAEWSKQK
jgi:hypothetical protein